MIALNSALCKELVQVCEGLDKRNDVGAIVLTGNKRAFAAGADIKEMADKVFP